MKFLLPIVILCIFLNCKNTTQVPDINKDTVMSESFDTASPGTNWLADSIQKRWANPDTIGLTEIRETIHVNDSVYYVVYTISGPVNYSRYVITFRNNKTIEEFLLSNEPDADFSIPYYEHTDYTKGPNNSFLVSRYKQEVKFPERVLTKEGDFKKGFNFENVDIKTDTLMSNITINPDGSISREEVVLNRTKKM